MKSNGKTKLAANRKRAPVKKDGNGTAVAILRPLTANSLKEALWDTLQDIRSGDMQASKGDAIASQAREILRTVRTQMQIATQSKRGLPQEIVDFSEKP